MQRLRLFPLNTVLFPGAVLNLHVFEPRYRQMIAECLETGEAFGVCLIREGAEAGDLEVTPHAVGTVAEISDTTPLGGGRYYLSTVGGRRFRIEAVVSREPYLLADVSFIGDEPANDRDSLRELVAEIRGVFADYLKLLVEFSGVQAEIDLPEDPVEASFLIGDALQVADAMKQRLLEYASAEQRLLAELTFLRKLLPQLRALLERKREEPRREKSPAPEAHLRAQQEKFFGRHFSLN